MDIRKGDTVAWPTNLGWMMGPWLVYASLLNGASIALYNGSPLGSGFAKFVQVEDLSMGCCFTVYPTNHLSGFCFSLEVCSLRFYLHSDIEK